MKKLYNFIKGMLVSRQPYSSTTNQQSKITEIYSVIVLSGRHPKSRC